MWYVNREYGNLEYYKYLCSQKYLKITLSDKVFEMDGYWFFQFLEGYAVGDFEGFKGSEIHKMIAAEATMMEVHHASN